ncbi:hypothetical protein OS493_023096 [Desmophyllum pertusum]|uniref:Uncharacterized protein n=1 Tax=Desmophyllum pertusum TaxID=174260 RepID=A0A9X0CRQ0_9CNID|nr:hypothetical protein OS493_023096 [Desmophyllum pertusum]
MQKDRQEGNQQMEGTSPDEEIETAESHRNTRAHFKKSHRIPAVSRPIFAKSSSLFDERGRTASNVRRSFLVW